MAIHFNRDLSDIEKFNYLRSLLSGAATDAIAGLALSSAKAIDTLCKPFGNKQIIISKHMDTLMNRDAISFDRHLRDLRWLYDITEAHMRSLKSLGIEPTAYGALLTPVLLSRAKAHRSTLFSGTRDSGMKPQCSYYQQSHSSASCSSIPDVPSRKQILKISGRCFKVCPIGLCLKG